MAEINLTSYFRPYECKSEWNDVFIPPDRHEYNYRFRLLLNVNSELGSIQMPIYSYETKETEWQDDELLSAFNKAYAYLKTMAEKDIEINIFREIDFSAWTEKTIADEILTEFTIKIPEETGNYKKLFVSLSQVKEAKILFGKAKDILFKVIDWGNPSLENNYYSILKIIDYLHGVSNAAVVNGKNKEYLSKIRNAFTELKRRKITQNHNYQTMLTLAQQDIYSLEFPKFFKSSLPNNDISQVLDEIR
jgi:hypothetical protein